MQGFLQAATALTAQGLHGLHASSTPAMHSSIDFFAAHGLQGLQAARTTPVLPAATRDTAAARAKGLRRLVSLFFMFVLLIFKLCNKLKVTISRGKAPSPRYVYCRPERKQRIIRPHKIMTLQFHRSSTAVSKCRKYLSRDAAITSELKSRPFSCKSQSSENEFFTA